MECAHACVCVRCKTLRVPLLVSRPVRWWWRGERSIRPAFTSYLLMLSSSLMRLASKQPADFLVGTDAREGHQPQVVIGIWTQTWNGTTLHAHSSHRFIH